MTPKLSENALKVLERRYLKKDETGKVVETPEELFRRVATAIADADKLYGHSAKEVKKTEEEFYNMMVNLEFMPNTPTLVNAGRQLSQLSACFVIPVEDSMNSIFEAVKSCALIHRTGGGTGMSFSRLRPKDSIVKTTGGLASGPVSFMKVFDAATQAVRQGGVRRGANMGILRVDHPDILEFITCKEDDKEIANFNISVAITDDFMQKLEKGEDYDLIDPHTKKVVRQLNTKEVFDLIVKQAHKNGEPGVVFIDRMNEANPTPALGNIESTNPCVTPDTLVSTDKGPLKIEQVHNPLMVWNLDGVLHPIVWAGSTGRKEVFRIKTKAGYELKATGDHKVLTADNSWKPISELHSQDRLVLGKVGFGNFKVDREIALMLGWLVGDGCLTKDAQDVIFYFDRDGKSEILPLFKGYLDHINRKPVKFKMEGKEIRLKYSAKIAKIFQGLGVKSVPAQEKEIPESVFRMDKQAVKNFLSALFSADGSVQGNRNKGVSIRLASSSLKLLKQVQVLLLGFEVFSKIYENRRSAGYKKMPDSKRKLKEYFCQADHELVITRSSMFRFMDEIGFCIATKNKKFEHLKPIDIYRDNLDLSVESIEPLGIQDVYDLTEPNTHSFVANGLVVHNCGEVPLLPYESCNLASINLFKMAEKINGKYQVNWERLRQVVHLGVHFLDNVIDANKFPLPKIEKNTKLTRKIGLGVMGWASLLVKLGIPYNSEEALTLAHKVMGFILEEAKRKSIELAKKRGLFPAYKKSIWEKEGFLLRNATLTTIAPTGTISIIAGPCSSGIEPLFAIVYHRNVMDNDKLVDIDPLFEEIARQRGFYSRELMEKIAEIGSIQNIEGIPEDVKRIFVTAHDISPEWHVRMQAVFQQLTHNSVSKTINFPNEATVEDVRKAYLLAYELGCKGITVYRDRSREEQVLNIAHRSLTKQVSLEPGKISPRPRPEVITGTTTKVATGCGNLYVTINIDEEGKPFELFTQMGKAGGCAASQLEAIGRLVSLAFRSGIEVKSIIEQLRNIRCPSPSWEKGQRIFSCADAIARVIEERLGNKKTSDVSVEISNVAMKHSHNDETVISDIDIKPHGNIVGVCPDCGGALRHEEGCVKCQACGYSKC